MFSPKKYSRYLQVLIILQLSSASGGILVANVVILNKKYWNYENCDGSCRAFYDWTFVQQWYSLILNTNFLNFPPTTGCVRMAGCYGQLERGERKKVFRISKPDVLSLPHLTPRTGLFTVCPAKQRKEIITTQTWYTTTTISPYVLTCLHINIWSNYTLQSSATTSQDNSGLDRFFAWNLSFWSFKVGVFNQRRDEKRGRGVVTECNKETGNLVLVQFQLMYGEPSNGGREGNRGLCLLCPLFLCVNIIKREQLFLRGWKVWWGEVTLVKPIIITTRSWLSSQLLLLQCHWLVVVVSAYHQKHSWLHTKDISRTAATE